LRFDDDKASVDILKHKFSGVSIMILHITDAKYLHDYQVWTRFNDGSEGIVDLIGELWGTVFEPLKDLSLFSQVKLDNKIRHRTRQSLWLRPATRGKSMTNFSLFNRFIDDHYNFIHVTT